MTAAWMREYLDKAYWTCSGFARDGAIDGEEPSPATNWPTRSRNSNEPWTTPPGGTTRTPGSSTTPDDVLYIEHAAGTMHGRDEVPYLDPRTMLPSSHMTHFPSLWHVISPPAGSSANWTTRCAIPATALIINANISIITYARDGKWAVSGRISSRCDSYEASIKWCRKAQELGTLDDDAAAWLAKFGGAAG